MVMYKIDRRGGEGGPGGVQKSFSRKLPICSYSDQINSLYSNALPLYHNMTTGQFLENTIWTPPPHVMCYKHIKNGLWRRSARPPSLSQPQRSFSFSRTDPNFFALVLPCIRENDHKLEDS